MEQIERSPRILVVTVLYNQALKDTNVYKTLLKYCPDVYIQDNSPSSAASQELKDVPENWIYVKSPDNPGLSKAYNSAARYAASRGIKWVIITDQDTVFPCDYLEKIRDDIALSEEYKVVVPIVKLEDGRVLSPAWRIGYFPRMSWKIPAGKIKLRDYAVINSGMAVKNELFEETGGYNERVFLDMSDMQFLERVSERYPYAKIVDTTCLQNFSATTDKGENQLRRFSLFCRSVKNYESSRRGGKMMIGLMAFKRMIHLMITTKGLSPLKIFIRDYL